MPSGRLMQRWPSPQLSAADQLWCMYAFVALVYGLLLPMLLLFVKEVHFRGEGGVVTPARQRCALCHSFCCAVLCCAVATGSYCASLGPVFSLCLSVSHTRTHTLTLPPSQSVTLSHCHTYTHTHKHTLSYCPAPTPSHHTHAHTVRFLSFLRPAMDERAMALLRSRLYSVTTSACFLTVTMVPCAWSLVQLVARCFASPRGMRGGGLALLGTVLSLEIFMRFWLLAVLQLVLTRLVRPALLMVLVALARRMPAAAGSGHGGAAPAAAQDVRAR